MEGRPQYARAAISPLGLAKESWDIITRLANKLDLGMPFKNLADIRNMLAKENAVFANIGTVIPTNFIGFKSSVKLLKRPLEDVLTNYYMTDPISRSSVTMAKCVQAQNVKEELV
jgi:NADH-quinone oxidoreductase subunit G